MIKEICSIEEFNNFFSQWNNVRNRNFWLSIDNKQAPFCPLSIEKHCRTLFFNYLETPKALPYLKLWSFEEDGFSVGSIIFSIQKNPMIGKIVAEEILWQMNGKKATSFKDKKILISLLRFAEKEILESYADFLSVVRPINTSAKYYLKNNYVQQEAIYSKKRLDIT